MIEVFAEHLGEVQFEVRARGHKLLCDQPASGGGFDEGMTPPELMLASLASCAGYYAAEYLKSRGIVATGTVVRVTAEKAKAPARLDDFQIEVDVPLDLSDSDQQGMERAVHKCLVHNTLLSPPSIHISSKILHPA
ncbi:MAG: OsmC family protein [Bryobacteraceae bacterium]|nr:OsmC family protein [Bryobacteraceae bacterium]